MKTYNIYCDESCHLLNDHQKVFVLGAVWVEKEKVNSIFHDLREIKKKHGLSSKFEAKWTKISSSKIDYYKEVVEYFFNNQYLYFRGVVVPDKSILDHGKFMQNHDTWYYKMFYTLLHFLFKDGCAYDVYLDIKDTKSNKKILELKRILNITNTNSFTIHKVQQVHSYEIELMQVVDLLIGSLAYANRGLNSSRGKNALIELIEEKNGRKINVSSTISAEKYNVLVWKPRI